MEIKISQIPFHKTFVVRHPVLREGRPIEECYFEGDDLESTKHFGCYLDDKIIGVASLFKNNHDKINGDECYQLRGMAVLKEFQNHNFGSLLLSEVEKYLKEINCAVLWFNARTNAVPFYKKHHYVIIGNAFDIPNVGEHYLMSKNIMV